MAEGTPLSVGVSAEHDAREHRVSLDPSAVASLVKSGYSVVVHSGAGVPASFSDQSYVTAGASLTAEANVQQVSDILPLLALPTGAVIDALRPGQLLVGLVDPANNLEAIAALARRGVTVVALDLLPRTLSRAQAMDALSSQSSAAGYRAAIVAADRFGRYLPMMITASGTATPAKVIVIGTGVAGLQAIATSRRLGAVVTGYDVRPASRSEVESLGARFLTSSVATGAGEGGYARAFTEAEQAIQQQELASALPGFDIIITTARVPGRTPPVLVSEETLASLKPGSVCIDLGASDRGGNVVGSVDGETVTTANGVTIVGAGNLAADLPTSSSEMYGRNIVAALTSVAPSGQIVIDPTDEIHRAIVVCHGGEVTNVAIRAALNLDPLPTEASTTKPQVA
ncbi:NAD(P) transhydrogenase subunit alpha [Salinibacterium sp. G-O1]|uniref:NAD(P) transhydrogenase subunit alpha n=1 Tax=Salinibacterium sp. G-O1 TaxID=3046208 RepID=UPI0024BBE899|nr:NAD(P) transhydrogenase subunit alpha [Salinibacterium sp. G-O1]MDJ0336118.1 NAD(P) transhydrogenase subunit alpha [Salinibacterium sp. G-O1]